MANLISKLSVQQLQRAIAIRSQIEQLEAELEALGTESAPAGIRRRGRPPGIRAQVLPGLRPAKKRIMSPEARARIATAQKARWAKVRASKGK